MNKTCFSLLSFLCLMLLGGCNNNETADKVPNYFKHGMNGPVYETEVNTFALKNGVKEDIPANSVVLWGDKDNIGSSLKQFDKEGRMIKSLDITEWATYNDTTITSYEYNSEMPVQLKTIKNGKVISQEDFMFNEYDRDISLEGTNYYLDSIGQIATIITDKKFDVHKDFPTIQIHHEETLYPNGIVRVMKDRGSTRTFNALNEKGLIISSTTDDFQGKKEQHVKYTKFDKHGNWTERLIVEKKFRKNQSDNPSVDTLVQTKKITYYEE